MDPFLLPVHNVQETSEGHRELGEGEERGGERSLRAPTGFVPFSNALGVAGHRLLCTETACGGETEAAAGERGGGGAEGRLGGEALVGSIIKRNRESQKMFKTKGGTILQRRRSLIPKLCRQESSLRSVQRVYCVGSQAESGNMKKWGGVESTVEGKSVRRRLRMAGKCHQGECSGTK